MNPLLLTVPNPHSPSPASLSVENRSTSNLIEIEFADIERHRPIRFNDYTGYTMAAMGTIGAAFASPITKEGGETVPSQVFYRPFDSWAPNSDWTVNLAKGEEATAIAVGATFVAVATSTRFLRIFSFSGVQLTVISLMGDAVCMSGQDNMLGVVYHTPASPSLAGDQVCLISQYSDLSANNSYIRSISQT